MPRNNCFRHQEYHADRPAAQFHLLRAPRPPPRDSDEYRERMRAVGAAFRSAGVAAIYLVHGTFVGEDAIGLLRELSRVWPAAAEVLQSRQKLALDWFLQDGGNFTREFARDLEHGLRDEGQLDLPVKLFHWTSENNHIGRADGAVRLIAALSQASPPGGRVMLWGHSHGGNVFALLTNLLGADSSARERFFAAARSYERVPILQRTDLPVWHKTRKLLDQEDHGLRRVALDLVTFGTPVRYGWDSGGYAQLLHFVHHRPAVGWPEYLTPFPPTRDDFQTARHGDFVQQVGIAGTNIAPNIWVPRALLADWRLSALLQPGLNAKGLPARLKLGVRVPDEGETLLVDYGPMSGNVGQHVAGHAVYTRREWILFHAEEIARRLYSSPPVGSGPSQLERSA